MPLNRNKPSRQLNGFWNQTSNMHRNARCFSNDTYLGKQLHVIKAKLSDDRTVSVVQHRMLNYLCKTDELDQMWHKHSEPSHAPLTKYLSFFDHGAKLRCLLKLQANQSGDTSANKSTSRGPLGLTRVVEHLSLPTRGHKNSQHRHKHTVPYATRSQVIGICKRPRHPCNKGLQNISC